MVSWNGLFDLVEMIFIILEFFYVLLKDRNNNKKN